MDVYQWKTYLYFLNVSNLLYVILKKRLYENALYIFIKPIEVFPYIKVLRSKN